MLTKAFLVTVLAVASSITVLAQPKSTPTTALGPPKSSPTFIRTNRALTDPVVVNTTRDLQWAYFTLSMVSKNPDGSKLHLNGPSQATLHIKTDPGDMMGTRYWYPFTHAEAGHIDHDADHAHVVTAVLDKGVLILTDPQKTGDMEYQEEVMATGPDTLPLVVFTRAEYEHMTVKEGLSLEWKTDAFGLHGYYLSGEYETCLIDGTDEYILVDREAKPWNKLWEGLLNETMAEVAEESHCEPVMLEADIYKKR